MIDVNLVKKLKEIVFHVVLIDKIHLLVNVLVDIMNLILKFVKNVHICVQHVQVLQFVKHVLIVIE